jgi:CheY-like chemotaxis protein
LRFRLESFDKGRNDSKVVRCSRFLAFSGSSDDSVGALISTANSSPPSRRKLTRFRVVFLDVHPRRRVRHLDQGIGCALFRTDYLCSVASGEKSTVIAIVDDDELVRSALQGLMKAAGFTALTFASGEEFLSSGELERTACLIADIRMPGLSGLELQSKLRIDHHKIPVIFITAQGDEKMRMQALRTGAVKFLTKPLDKGILLESVRAALDS